LPAVIVPTLSGAVDASTENPILPLPDPVAPEVPVIQGLLLVAVPVQPVSAPIEREPVVPDEGDKIEEDESVYEQPPI
jgi:hypothetical protein